MALRDKLNSLAAEAASKATSLAAEAASKANTTIENGKLALKINTEEKKIDEFTLNIGALILDKLDAGERADDEIMALYSSIQACRDVIAQAQEEMEANRQTEGVAPICSNCQAPLATDANFCPQCGTKVEVEVVAQQEAEEVQAAPEAAPQEETPAE